MAPAWRSAPATQRAAAALVLTDAPWALARGRVVGQRPFYLGAALTLFLVWPVLVSVGVLVGGWFTAHAVTALLPALTLGTVVVTQLGERPVLAAVSCAAVTAAATAHLPAGVSLLGCAVTGVLAATVAERLR
jgi:predicted branched-subunit amino acid permease